MRYPASTEAAREAFLSGDAADAPVTIAMTDAQAGDALLAQLAETGFTHALGDVADAPADFADRCHAAGLKALLLWTAPTDWSTNGDGALQSACDALEESRADGLCAVVPVACGAPVGPRALHVLRALSDGIRERFPGALTVLWDGPAFPVAALPTAYGGLGFDLAYAAMWRDDLETCARLEPRYRRYRMDCVSYHLRAPRAQRLLLLLPDALLARCAGDEWQRKAAFRAFLTYQAALSGARFLGDPRALLYDEELRACVSRINALCARTPALRDAGAPSVISVSDADNCVAAFLRGDGQGDSVLCVLNLDALFHPIYRLGLPYEGCLKELFNSDAAAYGGGNQLNAQTVATSRGEWGGFPHWAEICVPPLSCAWFAYQAADRRTTLEGGQLMTTTAEPSRAGRG